MNVERDSSGPSGPPGRSHPPQILLVEDDELHRHLMGRAFSQYSDRMDVSFAGNLEEARAYLSQGDPDLLIVDFVLPDGRGIELLPGGEAAPAYPVVFMTSHGDEQVAVEVMKSGAHDYIVKSETTLGEIPDIAVSSMREWQHQQQRMRAQNVVSDTQARLQGAVDEAPHPMMIYDETGQILHVNKVWSQLSGYSAAEVELVSDWAERAVPERHTEVTRLLMQVHQTQQRIDEQKLVVHTGDGRQRIWVVGAAPLGKTPEGNRLAFAMATDVTDSETPSDNLVDQTSRDPLTGLVERRVLEFRLSQVLETALHFGAHHALCCIDMDDFVELESTLGREGADELLRHVVKVLSGKIRRQDTLARLGDDEFGVLLEHCESSEAERVARMLLSAISQAPFRWRGRAVEIGACAGLVTIESCNAKPADVLSAAEIACQAAKNAGRRQLHRYREQDRGLSEQHQALKWVPRVNAALAEDRFHLLWQPITGLQSGRSAPQGRHHYELLLRMRGPGGRAIAPGAFLPAAERYNLSPKVDSWVVARALDWLSTHPQELARLHLCAINLSARSVADNEFLTFVINQFSKSQVPPEHICFEIAESAAVANLPTTVRFIRELKLLGCHFALDHFGSSLTSLAYLRDLPVDFLKIDGAFIRDIVTDPVDLALVRSINEVGHVMGKQTVAEWVESEEILHAVKELGINYAQGFTLGRPVPMP